MTILLVLLSIPTVLMLAASLFSAWVSGYSKKAMVFFGGLVLMTCFFIPLGMILLTLDQFGLTLIPMAVRWFVVAPISSIVFGCTILSAFLLSREASF